MKQCKYILVVFVISVTVGACSIKNAYRNNVETGRTFVKTGSVERLSPLMDDIIAPGEVPEIIAEGFGFTEGPLWLPKQNILLFSDIYANSVFQWSEKDGTKLYLKPSGYTDTTVKGWNEGSNGLLLDIKGRLVLAQHGDRRMARMDASLDKPEPKFITLADRWQGNRLNSPDDAAFSFRGDLYFTDPPYGLQKGIDDPKAELDFAGVYKLSKEGKLTLLKTHERQTMPNGIALSPNERKLYVGNSGSGEYIFWMEYDINDDGTFGRGRLFLDASAEAKAEGWFPDGLKVRKDDGLIFATGPGGVWIISPGGKRLGTIRTGLVGQNVANCAFGENGKYLYMAARQSLLRIRLKKY